MMLLSSPYSRQMTSLEQRVAQDEGFRPHLYRCPAGKLTIGYGWMIQDGMAEDEALVLMRYRLTTIHVRLTGRLAWYAEISPARQEALINMAYQLGLAGLLRFRRMLAAAAQGDWTTAAQEALDSRWAKQTPGRARRVATMLEQG